MEPVSFGEPAHPRCGLFLVKMGAACNFNMAVVSGTGARSLDEVPNVHAEKLADPACEMSGKEAGLTFQKLCELSFCGFSSSSMVCRQGCGRACGS